MREWEWGGKIYITESVRNTSKWFPDNGSGRMVTSVHLLRCGLVMASFALAVCFSRHVCACYLQRSYLLHEIKDFHEIMLPNIVIDWLELLYIL